MAKFSRAIELPAKQKSLCTAIVLWPQSEHLKAAALGAAKGQRKLKFPGDWIQKTGADVW
jgi:hypothetical protein